MEYTTPHTLQLNRFIAIISAVIKEGTLAMLLNTKLYETAHKTL